MRTLARIKAAAIAFAVGLVLSFGASAALAAPASAAGTFRLCNVSADYTAQAYFSERNIYTYVARPGQCVSFGTSGNEHYSIVLTKINSGGLLFATTLYYIPSGRSVDFHTGGTFNNPQLTPLVY